MLEQTVSYFARQEMKAYLPIAALAVFFLAGCEKDEAEPDVPPQPPVQEESSAVPITPPPPLPEADPPDETPPPTPLPGQVNDHSTPAFDEGGRPDPTGKPE